MTRFRSAGTLQLLLASFFVMLLATAGSAQVPPIPYQSLLLLVAGPSGDRIDPREKAVVAHLNGLRTNYNFSQLQMGTMHYDRPSEASLLKNKLGFSPQKGITVGLVQLSEQGLPLRTLYKMEQVTQSSLLAAQNQLLSKWSQTTGQPLPAELRPAGTAGGPSTGAVPPVADNGTQQPPWTPPTTPPPNTTVPGNPPTGQGYSPEAIHNVYAALEQETAGIWAIARNDPFRPDGNDLPVREQTAALTQATEALRAAHRNGVLYPMEQLDTVLRIGQAWQATEPQYFLPVPLRPKVQPMLALLRQLSEIQAQGRRQTSSQP